MNDLTQDIFYSKHSRLKKVLSFILPFLAAGAVLWFTSNFLVNIFGLVCIFLLFIDIGIIAAFLTKKFYNWIIAFIVLVIVAIQFKHNRWPGGSEGFTLGYGGLGTISLFLSFTFLKWFNHNRFLKYIGFVSSIVLFFTSIGVLWKTNHWPLTPYFLNFGMIMFIPFLFAFVLSLPNANFVNWNKYDRIVFFRGIIIPMIFLYFVSVLIIVFPDFWVTLIRADLRPFSMEPFELLHKSGLR
jgi:hypothetical protein